ncbi:MAG: SDR family oxidoreductase [Gammaproteobacteria bacterium]|nr:SDR family oxidoreductase [Gammaproteobacteria bacterium]
MKFLKLLLKIVAGFIALVILIAAGALLSMRAIVPDELYKPEPLATPQTASTAASYLVFGGRKNTGLEVIKVLRARGERVTAVIRPSSMTPEKTSHLKALGVDIIAGDALSEDDLARAFAAGDYVAVVSTIGCFKCDPPSDAIGNQNITDAASKAGVKRIIQVSSIGAGDSYNTAPLLSRLALTDILPLKTEAEDYLKQSGLDYTIVRPGGLKRDSKSGFGYLTENHETFGFIDREDLARLIVGALDNDQTIGKTYHAADEKRLYPIQ